MTSFADPGSGAPSGDESRNVQVNLDADVSGYSQSIGQAQQQTAALSGSVDKLSASMGNLSRYAGKQLIHFSVADFAAISGGVADAASLERQLGTLRATSVVTGSSMGQMKQQLDAAFSSFPVARSQVIALAETINNLGVTAPKAVGSMVSTFTKLGAATGQDPNQLAQGSLQLDRQLGHTDPTQVAGYANSLLTLSKNQGVATTSILDFASNIAPMARAAGIGQAAIQGISTAFAKAGADGGLAANAFNQITTEITQLSQTGNPQLARYSSFVGQSVDQFRGQSGTSQVTSVFDQIAKGGPEANSFLQSLGISPRAVKSIQAVSQGGGLGSFIAQAQGSTGDTKNLDEASKAAFSGLSNSVVSVGNEFTKFGEMIGEPVLKPLTMLTDAFDAGLKVMNKVVSAMGPIPAILGTLAGALAIPAGVALGHLGIVGGLAAGRVLLGANSGPRTALREGRAAGAAMFGGATREEAMAANRSGQMILAGGAPRRLSLPYSMGMAAGQRGPGMFEQRYGTTMMGMVGRGARTVRNAGLGGATYFMNEQSRTLRDSRAGTFSDRSFYERQRYGVPRVGEAGFVATVRSGSAGNTWRAARGLVQETTMAAGSMAATGVGTVVRAGSPGMIRSLAADVGGVAARGAGGLFRGASALAGAAFSPLGLIATTIGVPLVSSIVSSIKTANAQKADVTGSLTGAAKYDQVLDRSSTNLAKFGQSVDDAANKLSKFTSTPVGQLSTVSGADVNAVKGSDYKIADPALKAVVDKATDAAKGPGGDPDAVKKAVLGYLGSTGVQAGSVTGDTFTKYKQDLLSIMGIDKSGSVSDIMGAFASQVGPTGGVGNTPDLAALARLAGTTNRDGGTGQLGDYKAIMGTAVAGLQSGTQNSGTAGTKSEIANMLSLGALSTGGADKGQSDRIGAFGSYLQQSFGIDPGQFGQQVNTASGDLGVGGQYTTRNSSGANVPTRTPFGNNNDALKVYVKAFAATPQGKALMARTGIKDEAGLLALAQHPGALPPPSASDTANLLTTGGDLGKYAAKNDQFQQASTGAQSGNAGASFAAAQDLVGHAAKLASGNLTDATANLMSLSDVMGGMATPTGALIKSAADWARQLKSFTTPTLSRESQLAEASTTATISAAAANPANKPSTETVQQSQADRVAFEGQKESYRQYMIGRITQVDQFTTSQERAEQANALQVRIGNRDFARQQGRATAANTLQVGYSTSDFGEQKARSDEDFNKSRLRSQEDFGLSQVRAQQDTNLQRLRGQQDYQQQSERSQADYQLSVGRQNEDHLRDLRRQAATASQDIYNPFIREQTKATTDAGTLIYNLKQQNADIEKQMAQIADLKKKGVSQQSIDTLNLSSADNAQQVNTLDSSLAQNPAMTKQINALVAQRVAGTTKLTQSQDNMGFRNSEADFKQGMSRASEDFAKSQSRAADDYHRSAARMDTDFARSQSRASADYIRSDTRMSDDYAKTQDRAAKDQQKSLDRQSAAFKLGQTQAVQDHQTALDDMAKAFRTSQEQAAQDLVTSFKQYTGDFNSIFTQLAGAAAGSISRYAPLAGKAITDELTAIKTANPWITGDLTGGSPSLNTGEHDSSSRAPAAAAANRPSSLPPGHDGNAGNSNGGGAAAAAFTAFGGHAFGGISLTHHIAQISEHGPELILPLNSRGQDFMTGLITKSLAKAITHAVSAAPAVSTSMSNDNSISFAGADIKVVAADPTKMARELTAKAKLARLASPVRH